MLNSNITKIKIKVVTLLIILIVLLPNLIFALSPTKEFYVNDYANILGEDTKQHIIEKNISLNSQTGAQIIVVIVPNLGGRDLEGYSLDLARSWGTGDKEKNNGVLLLLALEERQFRVEVGYGLEGILPDGKTGRMQDEYIIPYLKNNEWDKGVLNGFNAFLKEICDYYEIDCDVVVEKADENISTTIFSIIMIIIFIFISIKFRGGPFIFFGGGHGGHFGGGSHGGFSGGRWRVLRRRRFFPEEEEAPEVFKKNKSDLFFFM